MTMRYMRGKTGGYTLIESMIVLLIVGIATGAAVPPLLQYVRQARFQDYSSQAEYLVKFARLYAMERTTNVGICLGTGQIVLRDLGTGRSADICSAGTIVRSVQLPSAYPYLSFSGSNAALDPRGLAITTGNLCTSYGSNSNNICIGKTRINRMEVAGGCGTCP